MITSSTACEANIPTMQMVWVVLFGGDIIIGVCCSRERAELLIDEDDMVPDRRGYSIEEYPLLGITLVSGQESEGLEQ